MNGLRILVGVCGSIAAYRSCELVRLLTKAGAGVRVLMTPAAATFVGPATLAALSENPVHTDLYHEAERVHHVELARWADAFIICGATATTLSRLARGDASEMVAATVLMHRGPLVVAPAMHTEMWEHPAVQRNVSQVVADGALLVGPAVGPLASGDHGIGRLEEPATIVEALTTALMPQDMVGVRVLITAGPTREPIDPVRFISNRSSGRMGFALATEARRRGADVVCVAGPTTAPAPVGIDLVAVETAADMLAECLDRFDDVDVALMNAAVADWTPASTLDRKATKGELGSALELEPTVDIAAELGRKKGSQICVAFAAETDDVVEKGQRKLTSKHADLVVANTVAAPGTGFDSETNDATIISAAGVEPLERMSKTELASLVFDRVLALRSSSHG